MADLQIIITGENQSGAAFDSVKKDLGDVEAQAGTATKTGTGFFSGMLQTAGGFLAANVLGNIAGQITGFVSDGVAAAQDTAKLMAATENIIKNTGGAAGISAEQVADLATSLSDAAGKSLFGDDQIQGAENVLLKYKELKGIIPGVTTLAVDMAASLGKDPAAAAEVLGRALQKPEDAAGKLAKMGIVLTDQQKDMIKTMVAAGDTAGAQKYLMDQLNGTFAGSAEAQAKAAGGMVQFKARMGEVSENIGAAMLPILNQLADILLTYVAPAIEVAAKWLGENLPKAIAVVSDWLNSIMAMFQSTGGSSDELSDVLSFLGEVWDLLADIIKLNVDLILAIVIPTFKMIAGFINDHGTEIKAILNAVWTVIKTVITTTLAVIKGVITAVMQAIKGDWSGAWDTIKGVLSTVWGAMKTIIDANITIIKTLISGAWTAIKSGVVNAWDGIKSAVASAWDSIKGAISGKINELKGILEQLPSQASGIGEKIVNTIWNGLRGQWDSVMSWLRDKLAAAREIWDSITGGGDSGSTQGNATGTSNFRGGRTWVGEFGPELVSLPRGSAIHTASDSRAMLGGGDTFVFNFADSVSSYDRSRLESETRKAMDSAGDRAFNRMRTGG